RGVRCVPSDKSGPLVSGVGVDELVETKVGGTAWCKSVRTWLRMAVVEGFRRGGRLVRCWMRDMVLLWAGLTIVPKGESPHYTAAWRSYDVVQRYHFHPTIKVT